MKPNYVLIDYENIQPETADTLAPAHFKVLMFVGANQPRVNIEVASTLQAKGTDARYIRISAAGRNALDFHIAYYLGQLAAAEPEAYFHVISADKGMDPLMQHMQAAGLNVGRYEDVTHIPIVKLPATSSEEEKLSRLLAYLVARGPQRPASVKTLFGSASALFSPTLSEDATAHLLHQLERQGIFVRKGSKVTYSLPD
ncbi:PIN domain-containing protein [Ramlibacter solisilvae]|uniref:PIN-like domain-containing protein n=1 Tax=Ramlibacter tataouinensis TaxID=94132 RepID=A0A127JVN6_9BURK|nr:PIN domain-containing protein [Ramlibacter tataouinensis]AMO24076.1 hypothetical protein UC35_16015 [Ramlibacter tataouinensis]